MASRAAHDTPGILLVDDDPVQLLALEAMLEPLGSRLLRARSIEEALRMVGTHEPAAVLLDVRMPGVHDVEVARLFGGRADPRRPAILLIGPWPEVHALMRNCEWEAADYLPTPLVPAMLQSRIAAIVDLHWKDAALRRETRKRQAAEAQLRALAARLICIREEERAMLAREIHDELGQALTGLKMDVNWLAGQLGGAGEPIAQKTEAMLDLLDASMRLIRRISTGLRSETLDEMGLVAALEWQAKEFEKRMGLRCKLRLPQSGLAIEKGISTAIFRIFQEILTNVARHARANSVDVHLRVSRRFLTLRVRDDGSGISEAQVHCRSSLGLVGMRERAHLVGGEFRIRGSAGQGTSVFVSIPWPLEEADCGQRSDRRQPSRKKPKQRADA